MQAADATGVDLSFIPSVINANTACIDCLAYHGLEDEIQELADRLAFLSDFRFISSKRHRRPKAALFDLPRRLSTLALPQPGVQTTADVVVSIPTLSKPPRRTASAKSVSRRAVLQSSSISNSMAAPISLRRSSVYTATLRRPSLLSTTYKLERSASIS